MYASKVIVPVESDRTWVGDTAQAPSPSVEIVKLVLGLACEGHADRGRWEGGRDGGGGGCGDTLEIGNGDGLSVLARHAEGPARLRVLNGDVAHAIVKLRGAERVDGHRVDAQVDACSSEWTRQPRHERHRERGRAGQGMESQALRHTISDFADGHGYKGRILEVVLRAVQLLP